MKFTFCLFCLFMIKSLIHAQEDIVVLDDKTIKIQLDKIGKPEHFKTFHLFGYAPLVLKQPAYYNPTIITYPSNLKKSSDIAFAEITSNTNINKQIAEKYYFLVSNYRSKSPEVFMSKEGEMDFSNNFKIITKKKRKYDFRVLSKKGSIEYIIDYNQKLSYGIGFSAYSDTLNQIESKYSIPIWEDYIKYGTLKIGQDSVCIALYDVNRNGLFNEIDEDQIVLIRYNNLPFFEITETFGSMKISKSNCINIKNEYYDITYISKNGTTVCIKKVQEPINDSYLRILDKVPDEDFINSDSSSIALNKYFQPGKFLLVNIWTSYCETCINYFPKIDSLLHISNNSLKTLSLLNKNNYDELKKLITKFNIKSPTGVASKRLNLSLHLSGYPYMILFDKTGSFVFKTNNIDKLILFLKENSQEQ